MISDKQALLAHEALIAKLRATWAVPRDANVTRKARTIEGSLPKSVSKVARDVFLIDAAEAIAVHRSLKSTGTKLPRAAVAIFETIAKSAARWEVQLSKWSVKLPELRRLSLAAERRKAIHQRSRGRSSDPLRARLIFDLYDAYVIARGGDPTVRGFQRVANSVLRAAKLPPVTKHDMSQIRAQRQAFVKFLTASK